MVTADNWYVQTLAPTVLAESAIRDEMPTAAEDLSAIEEAPHKILCMADGPEQIAALGARQARLPGACLGRFSHANYLDTDHRIDKGWLLKRVYEALEIKPRQVIAMVHRPPRPHPRCQGLTG